MVTHYLTKKNYSGRNNPENLKIWKILIQTIGTQQQSALRYV